MQYKAIILLFILSVLQYVNIQAIAENAVTDVYKYSILSDDTICIEQYSGNAGVVFIPKQIEGKDVTQIGKYAFQGCNAKRVYTPETLVVIDEGAFQNCRQLENINLKNGLEKVSQFAFRGCDQMKEIILPESLREVDGSAFILCDSLLAIHVEENNPWFTELRGALYKKDFSSLISVPAGRKDVSLYLFVEQIGDYAFYRHLDLQDVFFDENLKKIGDFAFAGCLELEIVQLPEGLEEIGNYVFMACPRILRLKLPTSVIRIGEAVFLGDDYIQLDLTIDSEAENYARANGLMYSFEPEW